MVSQGIDWRGTAVRYRSFTFSAVAMCILYIAAGCGCAAAPPGTVPAVHNGWIVIDPVECGQSDCVCGTRDPIKASPGDTVQWINATSAQVTITPSTSGAFTGPNTHTVGNVAGVVTVNARQIVSVTVSTELNVGASIPLKFTTDGISNLCDGYEGPRMEID